MTSLPALRIALATIAVLGIAVVPAPAQNAFHSIARDQVKVFLRNTAGDGRFIPSTRTRLW